MDDFSINCALTLDGRGRPRKRNKGCLVEVRAYLKGQDTFKTKLFGFSFTNKAFYKVKGNNIFKKKTSKNSYNALKIFKVNFEDYSFLHSILLQRDTHDYSDIWRMRSQMDRLHPIEKEIFVQLILKAEEI